MRIPLSWLREYVTIPVPVEQLAERLTVAGLEVADIDYIGVVPTPPERGGPGRVEANSQEVKGFAWERDKVFVGEVLKVEPHPNADRLTLVTVDYGAPEPKTVVTGAPNLKVGDRGIKVAFAVVGARLIDGHAEGRKLATLKPGKIRGVLSDGMVLSEKELGISDDHTGIIILPDDAPVGMPLADYLGDVILDLDMTPNLARDFAVIGVAREVAALTGQTFKTPMPEMQAEGEPPAAQLVNLEIADPDLCSRYSATIIRGVTVAPSPGWMARRITLSGMRPINNIVDITNYVMWEWGQPLHAFDYDKLVERARRTGHDIPTIIVRRARPGETMTTLDGVHRTLTPDMLLITDTTGPIAIAGVMGGAETEVSESTQNVLLEAANFNFISIRRTSAALKLPSEAATRFGRGIHPALTVPAAMRATELMRQLAGGTIARGVADLYAVPAPTVVVDLTTAEVKRILGLELGRDEIGRILASMEFTCEVAGEDRLRVTTPPHRLDIEGPHDLIEEIARIYGYDRLPMTDMADVLPPQRSNLALELEEKTRDILVGAGLQEIISYSLTSPEREAALVSPGQPLLADPERYVRIANPISPERAVMRQTLSASMLEALAFNLRYRDRVPLFEIGRVYLEQPGELLPLEQRRLAIGLAGPREPVSWLTTGAGNMDFFDLKGIVEALLEQHSIHDVAYTPASHPTFHPGRAAILTVGGEEIGVFGEVHPLTLERWNISAFNVPRANALTLCLAEFDLEKLLAHAQVAQYAPISRFPAVTQDIALVVDEGVPAAQVQALLLTAGGDLLRRVRLFDVYRGAPIPPGKKSLAYSMTFQSAERTLTDEEINKLRERIARRLEKEIGAQVRA